MKTPQPTSTDKPSSLGAFKTLRGGGGTALAAGPGAAPIVSLHSTSATWWTGDVPTEITFDDAGPVGGSVWIDGGKRLRVGLGTLDPVNKSFAIDPALQPFVREMKRIRRVAWFPDGARVALLLDPPALRVDQQPPRDYDPSKRELVIVSLTGTAPSIRRSITVAGTPEMAAGDDRVIVCANTTQMFDQHGEPVEVSFAPLPEMTSRVSFNAGRFVLVEGSGTIRVLDARSGATVVTWEAPGTADAVATGSMILAVDRHATVRVGCIAGGVVRQAVQASAGTVATLVQVVGDRVVVSADGPDPIRVATLTNVCP